MTDCLLDITFGRQNILETLLSNSKITVFNLQVYHGIYFQILLLPLLNYLSVYEYDE